MEKNDGLAYTFMVAGVVLHQDGKYLLVQEKKPVCYGKWNLPAGKVDKGYSIEETVIKEAKEESGFDVELIRKIGVYQDKVDEPVKHAFEAKIIGGELSVPENEILDAKWFSFQEILNMKNELRVDCVWQAIEKAEELR
ncbi:MAG: NUDIX domain-containing protein [Patescibacteria group bacterium]|jgi:ADP-ribose pyrophosphatase YjhB (NUDIX family)